MTQKAADLFSRARSSFLAGRLDEARAYLLAIDSRSRDDPALLHLLALVERKHGAFEPARAALLRALELSPQDPEINNNYANLLQDLGLPDEALRHLGRALDAVPNYVDARYNRALLLKARGRPLEALDDLAVAISAAPTEAKLFSARGGILRDLGRLDEAAASYDAALRLAPKRPTALHGRARVAMERGEGAAPQFYERALMQTPGNPELVLGLAEALEAEGDRLGILILEDAVEHRPDWIEAHEVLARMYFEQGEIEQSCAAYGRSLARRSNDLNLHLSLVRVLSESGRFAEALEALRASRSCCGMSGNLVVEEATLVSEAGDPQAALALLDCAGDDGAEPETLFVRGRIALKAQDVEQAQALLEQAVISSPDWMNAWAHLDLCWRLLGDQRHQWLSEQSGLFGSLELNMGVAQLENTARVLRTLHRSRSHPLGQSLRGGTQTRGRLFWRQEPELKALRRSIERAVEEHVKGLPPKDDTHPLLKHRDRPFELAGSWSVRLANGGFHVSHIHPEGLLSSACYISIPSAIGGPQSKEGWLEIGRPPEDLGIPLGALACIEPAAGRLALFPSYLFHGTKPFSCGERLTVAFDVIAR